MTTATEQTSAAALAPVTAQPGERYASRRLAQVRTRQGASSMTVKALMPARPRVVEVARQRLASLPAADVFAAANSYLGLLSQATRSHADRASVANVVRRRGHSVRADFGKAYRSTPTRAPPARPTRGADAPA